MISNLAQVDPRANIGKNVIIDPFVVIQGDVSIGDDSHVMSNAVILDGVTIGKGSRIFSGSVIGGIPQDLKFKGEKTFVEIGNFATIRECVTINRGTSKNWKTVIGNNCLLMAYTHIAHDCIIGNNVILANGVQLAGHVEIGDFAILGGLAAAIQFSRIGAHAYISGHAGISKDVPPFIKAGRTPLSYVGLNTVGLQRRGFTPEKINEIHEIYRNIYLRGLNITQALEVIEKELPAGSEKDEILNFIRSSGRGIIKLSGKDTDDND